MFALAVQVCSDQVWRLTVTEGVRVAGGWEWGV